MLEFVLSVATKPNVGVLNATPGACGALIVFTITGCVQCSPQSVDLTKLIASSPCWLNASNATYTVPLGATAMSAPWSCDAASGPPVEITCGDDHVAPPSVERLNTTGELPRAPWKSVFA